jgi:hypothetical protein
MPAAAPHGGLARGNDFFDLEREARHRSCSGSLASRALQA